MITNKNLVISLSKKGSRWLSLPVSFVLVVKGIDLIYKCENFMHTSIQVGSTPPISEKHL
jgi:hypothetical protein